MPEHQPRGLFFLTPSLLLILILVACHGCKGGVGYGGGGGGNGVTNYTIGGTVSGLAGSGLVLQNSGGGDLPVSANGSFTFSAVYSGGTAYNVTVHSQPSNPSQTCTVASGSGQISGANVTSIQITCSTNAFTIGGTVSGLSGTGLVLQDNGGNNLPISPGAASFTFTTRIISGGSYDVTVLSQPSSPNPCVVADGSGPVANGNITNIQVTCGTLAYASNQDDDSISAYLVSLDGTLTALPSSPFLAGSNPAGLAVDSLAKFLYVANVHSGDVSGYAIAPDGSLSPIPGSPFPAASGAISVAIDPTGNFLYVPSCGAACAGTGNGAIAAFSITPGTGVLVPVPGSPFAAGTSPYEMAFVTPGATGTFAYVANRGSNNISGFSVQPNGALSVVSGSPFGAGTSPLALAVDQAFNQVFAVNTGSGTVSAYSVHVDGSLLLFSTITTGASTTSAAGDANQHLYVTGGSGVLGFATNAFPVTPIAGSPFAAGLGPNAVRIAPGGEFLYVVNEGGNSVSGYSINASTGQLTQTPSSPFATGKSPSSIAFPAQHRGAVTWFLTGVLFGNGDTASGSFTYDADTNTVSNINIVEGSTTFTELASTFPVRPFEFVFVPSGMLTVGVPEPALVLFPTPALTDAGGTVSLAGSTEGLICDGACDGVTTSATVDAGGLTSTPPAAVSHFKAGR